MSTKTDDDQRAAAMASSIVETYRQSGAGAVDNAIAEDRLAASMAAGIMEVYRRYHPQEGKRT